MQHRLAFLPQGVIRNEIERKRAAAWFERTSGSAVRIFCAPVGSGKTLAVKQYAARRKNRVLYARLSERADAVALENFLAAGQRAGELILDDIDRIDAATYSNFVEDVCQGLVGTKVILVGRSRRRLQVQALVARGIASVYDPDALAFDVREIAELATAFKVVHTLDDVTQTLYDTEGWAVAVEWLLRDAAETGRNLHDAFAHWRERNGHLLLEFIENEWYADSDAFSRFRTLLTTAPGEERTELERLEQVGLPLIRTRAGARPYRILRRLAASAQGKSPDRVSRALPAMMMLNVLGQFRCEIAGRPVVFARRRDQNVFIFVALARQGRVRREAILEAFWAGIDHRTAAQALRTTISRIRRAIADAAPGFDADLYFETTSSLHINSAAVAIDMRRFVELTEEGRLDDAVGATDQAKRHYRLAYCMYHDRLLASEAPEPCFEETAQKLDALYAEVLRRLTELHAATGELDTAREYARELMIHSAKSTSGVSPSGAGHPISEYFARKMPMKSLEPTEPATIRSRGLSRH